MGSRYILSAKNKVDKSIYITCHCLSKEIYVCVRAPFCFAYKHAYKKTPTTLEAVVGRILGWLSIFWLPSIYALYHLFLLSVGGIGQYDALLLAWKKENSHVVECILEEAMLLGPEGGL